MATETLIQSIHDALTAEEVRFDSKNHKKKSKEERYVHLYDLKLRVKKYVRVNIGPIVGTVTTNSAIVMLEVNNEAPVTLHLVPIDDATGQVNGDLSVVSQEQFMPRNVPKAFHLKDLQPATTYRIVFSGISRKAIYGRQGTVRTFPEQITKLSIAALSCDRPERVLDGETNMWSLIQDKVEKNEVQIVLHLGDQVYGQKELVDSFVILRQALQDGTVANPEQIRAVSERVQGRLADIYRFTWNLPRTAKSMASGSHLMIWSDNDLYNDFTIAKGEKGQGLSHLMLHFGHLVYRRYQRQLWDPEYKTNHSPAEEHYHKYGPVGIILLDMRGNRIDWDGHQLPENPILSENQWKMVNSAFNDPEIKVMLVCSEIPFVGDSPEVCKNNSTKPDLEFLKDHWAYNTDELVRLLELSFDWKASDSSNREVVFIGGDIHVGVDSNIFDSKTGLSARHLTATPITNHVCKFFCALEGKVNDRFSYSHKSVNTRNYGLVNIEIGSDGAPKVEAKLVLDPNPVQHH